MTTRTSQSNKTTKMDRLAQSCPEISKRGILSKTDKPRKETQLSCPLTKTNNTYPLNDIDRLAQQWVQLLMDQIQETRSRQ